VGFHHRSSPYKSDRSSVNQKRSLIYIDLKAYRGFRYVREMLKMLSQKPEPILLAQIFAKLISLGGIYLFSTGVEPSSID
jgi:hypothetical protein